MKLKINHLILMILIVSSLLVLYLALANREANDNHHEVIQIILEKNTIPHVEDCWECYQPKLYHFFCAQVFQLLSIKSYKDQIIIAQLINSIAGIVTLIIIICFLNKLKCNKKIKFIAFSLVALNPKLIGINAQATNDSFVILFSTLTIYYLYFFLNDGRDKNFLLMSIFILLALLSKGNSLFVYIAVLGIFLIKIITNSRNKASVKRYVSYFVILNLIIIPPVLFLGEYYHNYKNFRDPFKINTNQYPLPHLFEKSYYGRPGIISVFDSYFTFRFIDLIKNPTITNGYDIIPQHRTSFWTQLYGRANFVHFDFWPPSWQTASPYILTIGRIIFLLALIPSAILIGGLFINIRKIIFKLKEKKFYSFYENNDWIFALLGVGYILFLILYTSVYRDFSTIKIIFLFPAILAFLKVFVDALDKVYCKLPKNKALYLDMLFMLIVLFYFLDIASLILSLYF